MGLLKRRDTDGSGKLFKGDWSEMRGKGRYERPWVTGAGYLWSLPYEIPISGNRAVGNQRHIVRLYCHPV